MADPTYRKQAVTRRWEGQEEWQILVQTLREKDRAGGVAPARDSVRDPVRAAWVHPVERGPRAEEAVIRKGCPVRFYTPW
ncbi:hypothetical protein [Candidatus Nitrospira nitrificans]|nr:hypothetical protein [Candidatus Nitrospira nitrificans]